jgi:hypothetical protein
MLRNTIGDKEISMANQIAKFNKFGYLAIKRSQIERRENGQVSFTVTVTVRRWHPAYWWFYWRVQFRFASEFSIPFWRWFPVALRNFFKGINNE